MNRTRNLLSFSRNRQGQTALIMILVLAMGFIFYAVVLNWSRMSDMKARTWMAAASASSATASYFASWGERKMYEQLLLKWPNSGWHRGSQIKHCEDTYLWVKVLVIIIIVVIMIVAHQYWLIVTIVMLIAAMIIEYAVVRPMMFSMWAKLQQNMETIDRFKESGVQTGLQGIVTDEVELPDRFDLDGNGSFGFQGDTPKDKVGRFSFYYTERLKHIKPADKEDYEAFRVALDNLIKFPAAVNPGDTGGMGFSSLCASDDPPQPYCNPACVGVRERATTTTRRVPLRRGGSGGFGGIRAYVPIECADACALPGADCPQVPIPGEIDSLLYDSSLEPEALDTDLGNLFYDPTNPDDSLSSFRARLGHDDEKGKDQGAANIPVLPDYDAARATGVVFPMLQRMDVIGNNINLRSAIASAPVWIPDFTDALTVTTPPHDLKVKAGNDICAASADSATGFWWKRGADRYCSGLEGRPAYENDVQSLQDNILVPNPWPEANNYNHYPYYECEYMYQDASGQRVSCPNAGSSTFNSAVPPQSLWPQDKLDALVYGLPALISYNSYLQGINSKTLTEKLGEWYGRAAVFISPQCSNEGCNEYTENCQSQCDAADADCLNQCEACNVDPNPIDCNDDANKFACSGLTCNPLQQGLMIQYQRDLQNWYNLLSKDATGWLNQQFPSAVDDNYLCPRLANGTATTGTPDEVLQCLIDYSAFRNEIQSCSTAFAAIAVGDDLPVECTDLQTLVANHAGDKWAFFNQLTPVFNIADPSTYTAFQTWLQEMATLKNIIYQRAVFLSDGQKLGEKGLLYYTKSSSKLFKEGADIFGEFLDPCGGPAVGGPDESCLHGGPAAKLMQAILDDDDIKLKRLPGFAIYGWKDRKTRIINGAKSTGQWHIVRSEIVQPAKLPWVKAVDDININWGVVALGGIFGFESEVCYIYKDGEHDIWSRVTRWDESRGGGLVRFANQIPIWRFRFNNPIKQAYTGEAGDISEEDILSNPEGMIRTHCIGAPDTPQGLSVFDRYDDDWNVIKGDLGKGLGLTLDTKNNLQSVIPPMELDLNNNEANAFKEAFMIDFDPRNPIPNNRNYIGTQCNGLNWQQLKTESTSNWPCCDELSRRGFWGYYWPSYCKSKNKKIYTQNMKNEYLRRIKAETSACFRVSEVLLNQGVKTASGVHFWVPNTKPEPYHEQMYFLNSANPIFSNSENKNRRGKPVFKKSETFNDQTSIF